jgi:hypothetical protein
MKAEMTLTVLEDGTLKIETGNLAGDHHASADEFIRELHKLLGGKRETKSTKEHHHHHQHQHEHHHH